MTVPLVLAGSELAADKDWVRGTHRAMDPAITLERIRPHLRSAGITRVADITDLDTVGAPVAVAIRPASGTLAVEGGKGSSKEAAYTSAAMEGIERYVAEEADVVDVIGSVVDVSDALAAPAEDFPLLRTASISRRRSYEWSWMRDLRTDTEHLVPADLVGLPVHADGIVFGHPWVAGSNGLASGNHLLEALCAALYEVVERDALTCWSVATASGATPLRVDLETVHGEVLEELLDRLDRQGLDVHLLWCPTDVGVPVFRCFLADRVHGAGTYKGYGAHLDPEVAMVRAITEAVQGRTIFVAGARDDLMRASYTVLKRSRLTREHVESASVAVAWGEVPDRSTSSFHGDVAVLLDGLATAGLGRVLVRELDASDFEVAVARVVVPGLEPYAFSWSGVGERARRFDASAFAP